MSRGHGRLERAVVDHLSGMRPGTWTTLAWIVRAIEPDAVERVCRACGEAHGPHAFLTGHYAGHYPEYRRPTRLSAYRRAVRRLVDEGVVIESRGTALDVGRRRRVPTVLYAAAPRKETDR